MPDWLIFGVALGLAPTWLLLCGVALLFIMAILLFVVIAPEWVLTGFAALFTLAAVGGALVETGITHGSITIIVGVSIAWALIVRAIVRERRWRHALRQRRGF